MAAEKSAADLADIILNRQNVALARSQRIVQSWLPPKTEGTKPVDESQMDDDLEGMDELSGIGSKRKAEDDEIGILGGLKKRRLATNDKLMEQLLGRKAAAERRKTLEKQKGQGMAKYKPLATQPKKEEGAARKVDDDNEDEDDNRGRTASFKSRKQKSSVVQALVQTAEPDAGSESLQALEDEEKDSTAHAPRVLPTVPAKRQKTGSYLDELLNKSATKKKKHKKKKAALAPRQHECSA
ncbi:hypothetical protein BAUCODRAFT_151186 [Baudoinia panamericana UAMH 10762]|uniref:Uncharacterized protein n=1 Tax=Baudoinia panamericana (strain UAMH 10762) TaxID=717646 RepID=M2N1G0_BAUPA|nr:uncharacterized protein BAUCODRAFT_151186 [Baudoinia panamericana UAMH 10762]EMC92779.1 hypothetical protein BAUCODRAFT_151186 [Baudoinia panamericana UAMH 10762]